MRAVVARLRPQAGSVAATLLAFASLALVFELPALLIAEPFRPSGEPLVVATAWLCAAHLARAVRCCGG